MRTPIVEKLSIVAPDSVSLILSPSGYRQGSSAPPLGKEDRSKALKVTDPPYRWRRRLLLMMDKPWFDPQTGTLLLDEYVLEMDSYRRIVEDDTITDDELVEQTRRVTSLLRQLEETLSPEAKAIATEALGELAVLNALQIKRLQAASVLPQ
jgi:hypothetical protein